jgi:hypothetical protein
LQNQREGHIFVPIQCSLLQQLSLVFLIRVLQSGRSGDSRNPQPTVSFAVAPSDAERKQLSIAATGRQLTVVLVTVCVVAIVLHMPSMILFKVKQQHSGQVQIRLHDALQVSMVLSTLNFAINFLLYFVSASSFRYRVVQLVHRLARCCRCRNGGMYSRQASAMTPDSGLRNTSVEPSSPL